MLNFFINILVSLEETSTFCRYDAILFENSIFTVFPEVALFFLSLIGLIFSITFFEKVKLVKEENTSLPLSEKAIGIELEKKLHKENEKIISSTEEGDKTKRLEEVMSFNQY